MILRGIVTFALGYAALALLMYVFQRSLMYFPNRARPEPVSAGVPEMRSVTLTTADGIGLHALYRPAAPGQATVVLFHGNAGNAGHVAHKARPLLDQGLGVLLVDYRGYGGNPGSPSEAGLITDGRAALEFLTARGVGADRTVLYGESLGSGVAVALAAETPIGAVILEAPFTAAQHVAERRYWYLPVALLMKDRFNSLVRIGRVQAPLLVMHGERDLVVPVAQGRALFAAANEPKEAHFIAAADHANLFEHGAAKLALGFLARHVPPR
ncbi:MAG: alpha/beta hydrolase [Alphaproteobacteria bacterium]|nr:alpha/beta hydrolase [Alphaproteobacteria bacterium]